MGRLRDLHFIEGSSYLLLRINTQPEVNFLLEHDDLIERHGYVWFCRFGRSNLIVDSISRSGNYIFIRDSRLHNFKTYIAKFSQITKNPPEDNNFPNYYKETDKPQALWFRLDELKEIDAWALNNAFLVSSSGNDLSSMNKSSCSNFYIRPTKDIDF